MGHSGNGSVYSSVSTWIREQIIARRDGVTDTGEIPDGMAIGREIWESIRREDTAGDPMAVAAVDTLGLQRVIKWAGDLCREAKVEAVVGWNGALVRHPVSERYAIPNRPNGTAPVERGSQYPLFVDVPREDYFALVARHRTQHEQRGQTIAVLLKGGRLLEQWPDAKTVRDACGLSGQDWRDYLVDEAL